MVLSGSALFVQRALLLLIFKAVRLIFNTLHLGVWHITGTAQKAADSKKPENYDRCAQVVNITWTFKFDLTSIITLNDFIYTHNRFVNPHYIFDNDDVTLLTVTDEFAVFAENREKGARLWRSEYNSFMRLAQLEHCDKLILVPRDAFHRMSEELGDISAKLVFLFNTARCGSTLLTQMLEYTGQCIAISEPDVCYYLGVVYKAKGNTPENRELSRDAFRWVCRPYKDFKPLSYCVKVLAPCMIAMPMFKETFPESKCIFMYREPLKVAKSIYKISNQLPLLYLINFIGKYSAKASEKCIDAIAVSGKDFKIKLDATGVSGKDFKIKLEDSYMSGIFFVIVALRFYLQIVNEGFDVVGVRYEDIISDPTFAFRKVLEYVGMPDTLVPLGLKGLEQDSQRNSILSMKRVARHILPDITPKSRELANSLLRQYGLPILGKDLLLPGTITCSLH